MDRRKFLSGAVAGSAAMAAAQPAETRGELKSAQYVVVELMGHKRLCGRLTQGFAGLLQLDVPVEGGFVTQLINPSSIYRVTIADEKTVRDLAKTVDPLPVLTLEVPPVQRSFLDHHEFEDEEDWHR